MAELFIALADIYTIVEYRYIYYRKVIYRPATTNSCHGSCRVERIACGL
jgi:hypothetical protein